METVTQHIFTNRNDVKLTETEWGTRLTLREAEVDGEPGSPALPVRKLKMAIPAGMKPVRIRVEIVAQTNLTNEKTFVTCIQSPRLPVSRDREKAPEIKAETTLPNEKLYRHALEGMTDIAEMGVTMHIGTIPIVPLQFSPIQYQKDGTLVLLEHVILHLAYDKDRTLRIKPPVTSLQRYREHSQVHDLVVNPQLVRSTKVQLQKLENITELVPIPVIIAEKLKIGPTSISVPREVDYLIITDNQKWDSVTASPTGSAGDLVAEFERLAAHKRERGYRTHIARISDIIADRYGNFRNGARDLQEVIRNFLKNFVAQKGVEWVLLGGDVSIVPHRLAAGCAWGAIDICDNVDKANRAVWKGSYLGMRIDPAVLGATTHLLTNLDTGALIPFDATGSSNSTSSGWYHTTNSNFNSRTSDNTEWIRVNGPAAVVNSTLIWYTPTNLIPTDLYYSSLFSSLYNQPGYHDWDLLGNGIHGLYGQHNESDMSLGGIDFSIDVGLGRAPVESVQQAKVFVDKTIAYEKWGEEHAPTAYNRFKKMLYVADHWGYRKTISQQSGNTMPPDNGRYASNTTNGHALLHSDGFDDENAGHRVVCNYSDTSRKVLSYSIDADASHPGWYYAKSSSDLSPSYWIFNFFMFNIKFPLPTPWIVVYGSAADISPMSYDIDRSDTDSSVLQQEELLDWMTSNFGRINQIERLYSDVMDTPSGAVATAGLRRLTSENLEDELNDGPHFVSLTGHGNYTGVAHLNSDMISRLTNGEKTFIAIADSCLTNKFDVNDAIGEKLLYHEQGGAVAYIGNSRYSWIGIGDAFRLQFFKTMRTQRNLARLNDSRILLKSEPSARRYKLWTILEQTLMGDPELNVYRTDLDAYPRYIGNWNTMEMHRSTCQWVKKMASYHKKYFDSIEEGTSLGYDGCAFCLKPYNHG